MSAVPTELGRPVATADARARDLHERYAGAIHRYCLNRLPSREDAEDATQTVFLNAYKCLAAGVEPRYEGAWLFKIAEYVVKVRWRSASRRARVEFPADVQTLAETTPSLNGEFPPELVRLTEALARMPEMQRRAILLREWQGLAYREIAAELGLGLSAVETLIFRARRTLAHELQSGNGGRKLVRGAFGVTSLFPPFKWLLEAGGAVKLVAGATSVAIVGLAAVGTKPLDRPVDRAISVVQRLFPAAPSTSAPLVHRAARGKHHVRRAAPHARHLRVVLPSLPASTTSTSPPAPQPPSGGASGADVTSDRDTPASGGGAVASGEAQPSDGVPARGSQLPPSDAGAAAPAGASSQAVAGAPAGNATSADAGGASTPPAAPTATAPAPANAAGGKNAQAQAQAAGGPGRSEQAPGHVKQTPGPDGSGAASDTGPPGSDTSTVPGAGSGDGQGVTGPPDDPGSAAPGGPRGGPASAAAA